MDFHHLSSNVDNRLAHIHPGFSAHFEELDSFFLKQLDMLLFYLLLGFVTFIHENVCLSILRVNLALFEPEVHDVLEGFGIVHVIH